MHWRKCVIQVRCVLRSVGKLTSAFCSTLGRAGDWLQSRGRRSSASRQAESKQRKLLMPWIIRKMFHPWRKWGCMSSKSFCLGLGKGIPFGKDFHLAEKVLTGKLGGGGWNWLLILISWTRNVCKCWRNCSVWRCRYEWNKHGLLHLTTYSLSVS